MKSEPDRLCSAAVEIEIDELELGQEAPSPSGSGNGVSISGAMRNGTHAHVAMNIVGVVTCGTLRTPSPMQQSVPVTDGAYPSRRGREAELFLTGAVIDLEPDCVRWGDRTDECGFGRRRGR